MDATRLMAVAAAVLGLWLGTAGAQHRTWIAVAAHLPGAEGTEWQTDLAVLNPCTVDVTITLHLHTADGVENESFEVAAGGQQVFPDVVTFVTSGDTSGALEVESSAPVTVASRTFNLGPAGTYGQSLDGLEAADGFDADDRLTLPHLREDGAFRSNIGVLNMGGSPASVTVTLFDLAGGTVGSFPLRVPPGRTLQVNRPFRDRFGRDDIAGGYAIVSVDVGSGVWAYGSVVDNATGDPTTVTPRLLDDCPVDIAERLATIEGLTVTEVASTVEGARAFELYLTQPDDHGDPQAGTFEHYLTLLHRDASRPVVLITNGYANGWRGRESELTQMLAANQLAVEHRFFASSRPSSGDWDLLTIEQAAADVHRVVGAFAPLYDGPWISTGHSKSGMAAVYHRRFYPDDVEATVAYVAPISFGAPDPRYVGFLETVGTSSCRQRLTALQRDALDRRNGLLGIFSTSSDGFTYEYVEGLERAFEVVVLELPFAFWQYAGVDFCDDLPEVGAAVQDLYDTLDRYVGFSYPSDQFLEYYAGYFVQAHTQLGFPDTATDHVDDLLRTDPPNPEAGVPLPGISVVFDATAMPDIQEWVAASGERLMFIYGENDPWTAGAFDLGDATDSHMFVVPDGTHGALVAMLPPAQRDSAVAILERWSGVTASPWAVTKEWSDREPPWRRRAPPVSAGSRNDHREEGDVVVEH